jgi:hypothetical protein
MCLCLQAVAAAVQASMASRVLEDAAQPKFDYDANSLYYCGSQDIARTCKIGWNNLDASSKVRFQPVYTAAQARQCEAHNIS